MGCVGGLRARSRTKETRPSFIFSFIFHFMAGKSPMIVYHQKNKDGKDMQYRNRPSLVTAEVDED